MPMYEAKWLSDETRKHTLHVSATNLEDAMCIAKFHARKNGAALIEMYEAESDHLLCYVDADNEESE